MFTERIVILGRILGVPLSALPLRVQPLYSLEAGLGPFGGVVRIIWGPSLALGQVTVGKHNPSAW